LRPRKGSESNVDDDIILMTIILAELSQREILVKCDTENCARRPTLAAGFLFFVLARGTSHASSAVKKAIVPW